MLNVPHLISIQLANRDLYPVFQSGEPEETELSLIPVFKEQEQAEIKFFYQQDPVSEVFEIGRIRIPELPSGQNTEIILKVNLKGNGIYAAVTVPENGLFDSLEMVFPENEVPENNIEEKNVPEKKTVQTPDYRFGKFRWVAGALFILLVLFVSYFVILKISDFGKHRNPPPSAVVTVIRPEEA
jgi:hypothetical protein